MLRPDPFTVLLFLMSAYTTSVLIVLHHVKLWNTSLLKDSIVWFCFTGILMCFNLVTSKKEEDIFRKIIISNIKIVIIIEFIINTYTFSLVAELFFIPLVILLSMIEVIAKKDKKYSSVIKIINGLYVIIGVVIMFYVISNVVSDYRNIVSLDTLRNILLAPLLTISFLPFIYFMMLFVAYESLFVRLNLGYEKSNKLKRYAKRKIIKHCLLSLKKVSRALNMKTYNLMHIRNKEDVDKMIKVYEN
jgi:hypothetical protein